MAKKKATSKTTSKGKQRQKAPTPSVVKTVEKLVEKNKKNALKKHHRDQSMDVVLPKKKKRGKNIDWLPIKIEYIHDSKITYTDLSKKYGISVNTISIESIKDDWIASRKEHENRLEANALLKLGENRVEQLAGLQIKHVNLLDKLSGRIEGAIDRLDKDEWEAKNTEALAKATKILIEAERLTLGLPSSVTGISDPNGDRFTVTIEALHKKAKEVIEGEVVDGT